MASLDPQVEEFFRNMTLQLSKAEDRVKHMASNSDMFFLIVNGIIVYFMQCGFAFLECGSVRSKNATNILLKNILDSCAMAYWIFGYAFAYGSVSNPFIGHSNFALDQLDSGLYATWFFQFVFAATAATIVSGALAERCDFAAYLIYSVLITGFVYPVVTHWAWDANGWLVMGFQFEHDNATMSVGYQDFAGSGVVHLLGGMSALVGAAILGPRQGRFVDGKAKVIPGHSVPLAALGGFILFFGFFSFNGGSQLTISAEGDGPAVALAVVNTIISGAFSGITSMIAYRVIFFVTQKQPKWSLIITVNGGLAGMVAICAGCNKFEPWAACVVGTVAGLNYLFWSWAVQAMRVDDPLDAVAVHAGSGLWGVMSVPLFAKATGLVYGVHKASLMAFAWNLVGALAITAWALSTCAIMFGLLRLFKIFRIDPEIEKKGLDMPKHGEPAYPVLSYGDGWTLNPEEAATDNQNGHSQLIETGLPYSINELPEEYRPKTEPEEKYQENHTSPADEPIASVKF